MALLAAGTLLLFSTGMTAQNSVREVKIRDIVTIEGVRDNPLIGYGMVVGLNGTGDRSQTIFTTQTLASILQKMGVQVPPAAMRVNNIAAVFVTASLPPFARPGTKVDVTISSIGDSKSLEGGLLLLTPLHGSDGQVYATSQGPLTVGGYTAGPQGNSKQVNHPTVARIPEGGIVERDTAVDLGKLTPLSLLLRDASFSSSNDVSAAINREFGIGAANAVDARRIDLDPRRLGSGNLTSAIARIESLAITVHPRAKVVVNERTGTIVMGRDVRVGAVSVLHGTLSIEISTEIQVSQPPPLSGGESVAVPQTTVHTQDPPARRVELSEGASVEQLVDALQSIGATSRDVIAILQAIKAAGALDAELEVI
jgi:flagellar P-ring protein FlgI